MTLEAGIRRTLRGSYRRATKLALKVLAPQTYEITLSGHKITFLTDDPYSKNWFHRNRWLGHHGGYHEPTLTMLFSELTKASSQLFDVGAHLGYYSILFASITSGRSLAIEFDPSNFRLLERAIQFQPPQVRNRITRLNVGAAEFEGLVDVPVNREPKPGHRVERSARGANMVPVRLCSLDDISREHELRPGLVKLDVEGLEVQVLRGAQHLLRSVRPVWMIEVHPLEIESAGDKVPELLAILKDTGYEILQICSHRSKGISKLKPAAALSSAENTDLICVPTQDKVTLSLLDDFLVHD